MATVEGRGEGARGEPDEDLNELAKKAFEAIASYVQTDLNTTVTDYNLLLEMNRIGTQKYSDMRHMAAGISKSLVDLNDRYRAFQPYLDQIDQLEASVTQLEQAAYRLDGYSKKLEAKFKQLEKR